MKSNIETLKQDFHRIELIAEADRLTLGFSPKADITGAAREWLQRRIEEACDVAEKWCELVERDHVSREHAQNQWLSNQVSELRTQVESAFLPALEELRVVASDSSRIDLSAAALCLTRSIHQMLDYLSIDQDMDPQSWRPSIVIDLQTIIQNGGHATSGFGSIDQLEVGLSARLLWIPAVDLGDDGRPLNPETPVDLSKANEDWFSSDTALESVVRDRVKSGDFRFFDLLKTVCARSRSEDIDTLYSVCLDTAKQTLSEHLASVREHVDQAATDGVIEYEGARWNDHTHTLDDIIVDNVLNFRHAHDTLDAIQIRVEGERTRRHAGLIEDWDHLRQESLGDNDRKEFFEGLNTTFESASRGGSLDIRVMEDCVSRMRNYPPIDNSDLVSASSDTSRTTLEEFLSFCGEMDSRQAYMGVGLRNLVRRPMGEV